MHEPDWKVDQGTLSARQRLRRFTAYTCSCGITVVCEPRAFPSLAPHDTPREIA